MDYRFIRLVFGTWYPWNDKAVRRRIRPLRIRRAVNEDLPWLQACYIANESAGRLPGGDMDTFQAYLAGSSSLILIAESEDGPVGTCGLHRMIDQTAWISYLLVDPAAHRQGAGTTLFLACLSLLRHSGPPERVALSSIKDVFPFYRKFGFYPLSIHQYLGIDCVVAVIEDLPTRLGMDCAEMLERGGARIDDLRDHIPTSEAGDPGVLNQVAASSFSTPT